MSKLAHPQAPLAASSGARLAPPSISSPSLVYRPVSYVEPLPLDTLFARPQPLEVELGSGDGGFLLAHAAAHPEVNFLGVERLLGRLRKLDRKGLRAKLTNLRLLRLEASYVITYLLPAQSVRALHVYCPDPWPKRRHQKRRLINEEFIQAVERVLAPGGFLYLRTDDLNYLEQMRRVCAQPFLEAVETPDALAGLTTEFERGFLAEGRPVHRLGYRLRPTPTHQ